MLELLIQHAGPQRKVRYMTLRKGGVPERVAEIYGSKSGFLDSLVNRKLQILQDKGWVVMDNSVYTILHLV